MSSAEFDFELFADGACSGNPGPGGWAYVLREKATGGETEGSDGESMTTNNRMELMSVIRGLSSTALGSRVLITTDSNYVAKGISEWMAGWKARGWKRMEGGRPKPLKTPNSGRNSTSWSANGRLKCSGSGATPGIPRTSVAMSSPWPRISDFCDRFGPFAEARKRVAFAASSQPPSEQLGRSSHQLSDGTRHQQPRHHLAGRRPR